MTFDAYSIALHVLVCKTCGTKASGSDRRGGDPVSLICRLFGHMWGQYALADNCYRCGRNR